LILHVKFYATLRQIVGGKLVEVEAPEGSTVGELLDQLIEKYPPLRHELFDEHGRLWRHVHVFVNGRDLPYLDDNLGTILKPEDAVNVFPAVGGG